MSCYFRHLKEVMAEAGIEVTPANRKEVDRVLHEVAGVDYKDCPGAWKNLKLRMANDADRAALVKKLRQAMAR